MEKIFCLPLLALLGFLVAPVMAQTAPPKQYDQVARETVSPNDAKAFVYQWFAGFDHQDDIETFLRHIDPQRVDMRYPDFPIADVADFRRWYDGVVNAVQWNSHDIRNLTVYGSASSGFTVSLDVCWKARLFDGKNPEMLVHQDWILEHHPERRFVLRRMHARKAGDC